MRIKLDGTITSPIIDFGPIRHGHWVNHISENGATDGTYCSICDYEINRDARYNYCPHCGAKMDKGEEDVYVDPNMYPCRICDDYDRKRGCISKGGCGEREEDG